MTHSEREMGRWGDVEREREAVIQMSIFPSPPPPSPLPAMLVGSTISCALRSPRGASSSSKSASNSRPDVPNPTCSGGTHRAVNLKGAMNLKGAFETSLF